MNDIAQTGLKEPAPVNWDIIGGSSYTPPPPAFGPDGKPITYYGVVESATEDKPDEGNLNFLLDPVKLVKSGSYDGYNLRFLRASTRVFTDPKTNEPKKGNPNKLAQVIRSSNIGIKPNTNADYRAAVKAIVQKKLPLAFTIDWEAYNKDNQESVKGYYNFPADPERPGQRKTILHAGDVIALCDNKGVPTGQTYTVKSDVLFANARIRFFRDPSKGSQG